MNKILKLFPEIPPGQSCGPFQVCNAQIISEL